MKARFWKIVAHLLSIANAGAHNLPLWPYSSRESKQGFYAFKERFLMRYGTPDGFDRQDLTLKCWSCSGTGTYNPCRGCNFMGPCIECNRDRHDLCRKCGGSGVFDRRTNWLARYRIGDQVFHIPVPTYRLPLLINPPTVIFTEKIKHPAASARKAWLCALVLFAIFDQKTLWKYSKMRGREIVNAAWGPVRSWLMERKYGSVPF